MTVLPCSDSPPAKPEGGARFYHTDLTKYACPESMEFDTGNYFEESECTAASTWQPDTLPSCVRELFI